jgi:hypothetical protein
MDEMEVLAFGGRSQEGLPQSGRTLQDVSSMSDCREVASKRRMAWRVAASMTL